MKAGAAGARVLCGLGLAACLLAAMSGCDDAPPPDVRLLTRVSWLDDPGSIDEIGYEIGVDVGWHSRPTSCFPLSPDLRVTVNDRQPVPVVAQADCEWDALVTVRGFTADTDVVVKLHDGDRLLGEATYRGMFPAFSAGRVVSPADGRVRVGEPVTVAVSPGWELFPDGISFNFHWLDMTGPAPPFSTFAFGTVAPDLLSAQATAPPLTGRALLVLDSFRDTPLILAESCTGFSSCEAVPSPFVIGPMPIEVIP
jgi:hypothetical protein